MLGLADRGRVLDLFDMILKGHAAEALTELSSQYADGADPMAILRDLAEISHWVSVIKITPDAAEDPTVSPDERTRGAQMAEDLPMRVLTRLWQMLLKALEEVSMAPNAMMAAEMAIIRLTHVADLPSPEELVRKLDGQTPPAGGPNGGGARPAPAAQTSAHGSTAPTHSGPSGTTMAAGSAAIAVAPQEALAHYPTFNHVAELIRAHRDVKLLVEVETGVRLAAYQPGRIEFEPAPNAPHDLAQRLGSRLQAWTGNRWAVTLVNEGGAPSIAEVRDAEMIALKNKAKEHPMVQAVLAQFPNAQISEIRTPKALEAEAQQDALQEVEDEWDPFEDS